LIPTLTDVPELCVEIFVSDPFAVFVVVVCDEALDEDAIGMRSSGSTAPSNPNAEWRRGAGVGGAVGVGAGGATSSWTVDGQGAATML
jgi:hypothetical protein